MPGKSSDNFQPETALVRQEVETTIELAGITSPLKEGICWQLSQKGKVLYAGGDVVCFSILPLLVCEVICATYQHAVAGAAAIEFFFAAGDAFDDIQDHEPEDSLVSMYGEEKALNTAIALLMLSQQAVTRLSIYDVKPHTIVSVMDIISLGGLHSCAGQHRDLSYEMEGNISTESYMEMIEAKSVPLTEAACHIGAILATEDSQIIDSYGLFGRYFGMAAQLINDAQSITTNKWRRSDISKKKKTLPVIFSFNSGDKSQRQLLEHVYHPDTVVTPELQQEAARAIIDSGGLYYNLIMIEKYKQLAVRAIEAHASTDSRLLALI